MSGVDRGREKTTTESNGNISTNPPKRENELLQNLLNKGSNTMTDRVDKRQKTIQDNNIVNNNHNNIESVPISSALYTALVNIHKLINSNGVADKRKIEIEIRVGMILNRNARWQYQSNVKKAVIYDEKSVNNLEFKSGVDNIFVTRHLNRIFTSENEFHIVSTSKQTIRSNSSNLRWEVDRVNNKIVNLERKERLFRWNYALLSYDYDLRIDAANESYVFDQDVDYTNWTHERIKHRTTYKSARFPFWKIDMTEVDVTIRLPNKPITNIKEYEFEIEMLPNDAFEWLSVNKEPEFSQFTSRLAENLELLIDNCIPSLSNDIDMTSFNSCNHFLPHLVDYNRFLFKSQMNNNNDFVGSMPFNITRVGLSNIIKNSYFITEKSDGVRYLLYIISINNQNHAILMNRSKELYELPNSQLITQHFPHGCIFDCEIVYHISLKDNMILVFDILAYDNISIVNKPFHDRHNLLETDFKRRCDDIYRYNTNNTSIKNIIINRKKYLPKLDIMGLLSKFKFHNSERIYSESNKNRHHKTDGIIFQPADTAYKLYSDSDLMKWKWSDLRTVDLQVIIMNDKISLYCLGPENNLIDCSKRNNIITGFGYYDRLRLIADYNHYIYSSNTNICIIEVMFDILVGHWKYFKIRSDKSKPNFIDVILSVYLEQAEDITIYELEYSITMNPSRKPFQDLINDKMKRLVEEVRRENYKAKQQQDLMLQNKHKK